MLPPLRLLLWTALLLLPAALLGQRLPKTAGAGLRAQYYDGRNFEKLVLTRLDPTIDFNWTLGPSSPNKAPQQFVEPGPGVPAEYFSVRWMGHLYAPVTGRYTFRMVSDDGMRVWVGGKKVLSSWHDQAATEVTAEVDLIGGRYYPLRVEYYQMQRDTRALLAWQRPDEPSAEPAPIPPAFLYAALPPTAKPIPVPAAAPPVAAKSSGGPAPAKPALVPARPPAPKPTAVLRRRPAAVVPTPVPRPAADSATKSLPDLSALSRGAAVTLPNLYFTQSTAALLPASRPMLNQLARTLQAQPALRLEIAGHTDNVGEPALNLRLSEQRARVVRRYLVQQGIDSVRLTAKGYGDTRPVADNRDPQQRPRNRRVEVVVQ
ncbi:PA14 domain-containing protein [Hymenobacter persicinus]|nr:PA14 domain-containing protein [Hymenobacter persicinus]